MIVYIAAPLSSPNAAVRSLHRQRAILLGRIVFLNGDTAIVPHLTVGGLFPGYPTSDETPKERDRAMRACYDLVEMAGTLFVLRAPDGSISDGCEKEMRYFREYSKNPIGDGAIHIYRWKDFEREAIKHGLHEEWVSLDMKTYEGQKTDRNHTADIADALCQQAVKVKYPTAALTIGSPCHGIELLMKTV